MSSRTRRHDFQTIWTSCTCRARVLAFFFNDTATTEIYTLSLHDALPISCRRPGCPSSPARPGRLAAWSRHAPRPRGSATRRSEEHTSELQSQSNLVCRLLLEKKKKRVSNTSERFSGCALAADQLSLSASS